MIALIGLAAVVVIIVYAAIRSSHASTALDSPVTAARRPVEGEAGHLEGRNLDVHIERWVNAGLLDRSQADAIRSFESAAPPPRVRPAGRVAPVAEALGYLGGLLGLIGLVLLVAQYWSDMPTAGRLALSGGGAVVALVAGALVRARTDPALARLQAFLWLASAAATALFAGVATADGLGHDRSVTIAAACAGAVALHGAALWRWRADRPAQQLTCLGAVVVLAGTTIGTSFDAGPGGLTAWTVSVALLVAGLMHCTPNPLITDATGALGAVVGALVMSADMQYSGFGLLLAAATAGSLLTVALVPGIARTVADQRVVGFIGVASALQTLPSAITYYAQDAGFATGLVTWTLGLALVVVGARQLVRLPLVVEAVGAATLVGGAALTGAQWSGFAPIFGLITAIALVAAGTIPGRVLLSLFGSLGLLINVPWAIAHFFPGEGRAPLLIMVSGALIIAVAVLLARMGGRVRRELVRGER